MTTAAQKMTAASAKIQENQQVASQIGAVYKFVLTGEGGGTWMVHLKDAPSIEVGDAAADCTLTLSAQDFVDVMDKKTEAQNLFFAGKLQIDGDMTLAMKLTALVELMS